MHREVIRRYRTYYAQQSFRLSMLFAFIFFAAGVIANFWAGAYATSHASNYVEDIILSNTPVFDVDGFFVYGTFLLIAFIVFLCVAHPKRVPFVLHALALFYFTRALFVMLTHIGPFPVATPSDFGAVITKFFFGGDLFFSGHTGAPFLLALIFWQERRLRYIFLIWSGFFAIVVLLGHLHYSIDVLAAFFITYTVYQIALWLFPKDHAVFLSEL